MIPLDKLYAILRKIALPTIALWGWMLWLGCRADVAEGQAARAEAHSLLAASVSLAERTLPVCLSADERMHGLLEDHATWRVEP